MSKIDVVDAGVEDIETKLRDRARMEKMGDALVDGNESLVFTFKTLARMAENAAEDDDLGKLEAVLSCIDQLAELGYGSRGHG